MLSVWPQPCARIPARPTAPSVMSDVRTGVRYYLERGSKNHLACGTEKSPTCAIAGVRSCRIPLRMKNMLLKQTSIYLAVVSLFSLLGACATSTSTDARKPPLTASRDSSGPVKNPDIISGGNRIPVTTYYDWPPFGDQNPR
jgi:hypothetical protein